jgi:5-methylcytosine-specific restriction endonuclease McrA
VLPGGARRAGHQRHLVSRSKDETVAIPIQLREAVDTRDRGYCRMCGKYLGERRAIHHIDYGGDRQGMGGRRRHALDNLISLCWLPYDNGCHDRAHSNKAKWLPLLQLVVMTDGVTATQLARWRKRRARWTR